MKRRPLFLVLAVALLGVAAVVSYASWQTRECDRLVAAAKARLDAPLQEAPELDRLQASTAASLLLRAESLGATDRETVGLRLYAQALEDFTRGDLVLSEGSLDAARLRLGDTADLYVLRAALALRRTEPEAAQRALASALLLEPGHARALVLSADAATDAGDDAGARALLDRAIAAEPRASGLWNRRALVREHLADLVGAESDLRRAIESDPRDPVPLINLGGMLRREERHADSLHAFESAVRLAPADADAVFGRGLGRAASGDAAGAADDFRRAAELATNDAEPVLALGDLAADLGDPREAVRLNREALTREDADAASWLKLGNALFASGEVPAAVDAFHEALSRAPDLAAAHNGLGAALLHLGEASGAARALARAAELDTHDPHPLMNLALLHERAGDRNGARTAWQDALLRDPGSRIAQARLAALN